MSGDVNLFLNNDEDKSVAEIEIMVAGKLLISVPLPPPIPYPSPPLTHPPPTFPHSSFTSQRFSAQTGNVMPV